MADKQLSVIIRAVDQATAPLRGIASAAIGLGSSAARVTTAIAGGVGRILSMLGSVRTLLAGGLAIAGVARLASSFNQAAKQADEVGKAAKRLGMSAEDLSILRFHAEQADLSFESLSAGAAKAQKNVYTFVTTGGGPAAEALSKLNVSLTDSRGNVLGVTELLPRLIEAMRGVSNIAQRQSFAEALFGRGSGEEFLNLIADVGGGIDGLALSAERARRLGLVWSADQLAALDDYNDALQRIDEAWLGLRVNLVSGVAPALTQVYDQISSFIAAVPKMAASASKVIADAFAGDAAARARLQEFASATASLIGQSLKSGAIIGVDAMLRTLEIGVQAAGPILDTFASTMPQRMSIAYNTFLRDNLAIFDRDKKLYQDRIDSSLTEIDQVWRRAAQQRTPYAQQLMQGLTDQSSQLKYLISDQYSIVRQSASSWADAANAVFGYRDALATTSMAVEQLGQVSKEIPKSIAQTSELSAALNGFRESMKNLRAEVSGLDGAMKLGRDTAQTFANSLSSGIASSSYDAITGVKSFGEAARSVMADTARAVYQTIVQFVALRAITGVLGGFFSGGATSTLIGPPTPGAAGGLVRRHGSTPSIGMAGGGLVPPMPWAGGARHADIVPAWLMPGEFVMPRQAVNRIGPDNLRAMAAGGEAGGSAGGGSTSVVINQTVNVAGGGAGMSRAQLRDLEDATRRAVIAGLEKSPGFRSAVRAAL